MTFFAGQTTEALQKIQHTNMEARHVGWVTCNLDLCAERAKVVKVELKGPDSHLRCRQVKVLGRMEGENLSTGRLKLCLCVLLIYGTRSRENNQKYYILMQIPLNLDIQLQSYEQFINA